MARNTIGVAIREAISSMLLFCVGLGSAYGAVAMFHKSRYNESNGLYGLASGLFAIAAAYSFSEASKLFQRK